MINSGRAIYINPPTTIPINITGKKITVQSNFMIPQDAFKPNIKNFTINQSIQIVNNIDNIFLLHIDCRECQIIKKCQKKKHQPLKVSVPTVVMQFYTKIPIESVCQSSFSELPHEQYRLAYFRQLKTGSQDYAFSYFL